MYTSLRQEFLLRDDIVFLNHGSFGACPRQVFDIYQDWQRKIEAQPVEFLVRHIGEYLSTVRKALGEYMHADADDIVCIPNSTYGVNIVAQSLSFNPGDEILTTDHEYGACNRTWDTVCARSGARYIKQVISLPASSQEEILEQFWQGVTSRTRVIFISHITSPTALRFPVEEICRRAREAGIMTLIDGSHAPGQLPLNLTELDADFYTGNFHKWLCSPKGAGFLYVRKDRQTLIKPLIISWGTDGDIITGNPFLDNFEWLGTKDPSAILSIPAAIEFQREHHWEEVIASCHQLARATKNRLCDIPGIQSFYPDEKDFYVQMFAVGLPSCDKERIKERLYDEYHIEVVIQQRWQDRLLMRVSVQGYNSEEDMNALVEAIGKILPEEMAR